MKRKVIIDTDPGHDDAIALMLACKSPEFEVLAVTTVCGNSTIENTTRNARFILDFIGRGDIPVYSGAEKPLSRDLVQAVVHGVSGLDGIDPTNESGLTGDAVKQLLRLIKADPNQVTLVTLGPLTNVARAIQNAPDTMKLVKEIVSMGGALEVPGNQNRVAEFNIFVDPEASDIVMRFPVPKTLVPLDACNRVLLQLDDIQKLQNNRLRELLIRMLKPYMANLGKYETGTKGALVYDALTVFYLLQPDSCQTIDANVQVETKGYITRGMTVIDKRKVTDGAKPNVTIVTHVRSEDFIQRLISTLNF
ncbi:MAG TPA: nucleoside hydrolase [Candidatus Limnocylindria bacterium]|nr:nucleoside hydrolase [Candidatus Limnocylindria bacterium]